MPLEAARRRAPSVWGGAYKATCTCRRRPTTATVAWVGSCSHPACCLYKGKCMNDRGSRKGPRSPPPPLADCTPPPLPQQVFVLLSLSLSRSLTLLLSRALSLSRSLSFSLAHSRAVDTDAQRGSRITPHSRLLYTLHSKYPTPYTSHPKPYTPNTPHPTPDTLHPSLQPPHTLHCTPCTLHSKHPTPYT